MVDVLEHVLVCEVLMAINLLQPSLLAKADELVVDEAILDMVELVYVLHNGLTLILHKVLDKSISAGGNPKSNVAVNLKRSRREQALCRLRCTREGLAMSRRCAAACASAAKIPFTRILVVGSGQRPP